MKIRFSMIRLSKVARLACLLLVLSSAMFFCSRANAQEHEALRLFFPFDDATLRPDYLTNRATLARLDSIFLARVGAGFDSVLVVSKSSPEGVYAYNSRLSERRTESMRKYLVRNYPSIADKIRVVSDAESWDEFRAAIIADTTIQDGTRQRMLGIIDSDASPDRKEQLLKSLPTWRRYYREYFPTFRFSAIDLYFTVPEFLIPDLAYSFPVEVVQLTERPLRIPAIAAPMATAPLFAVSTNLLYDLGGLIRPLSWTPNFAIEVPIGQKFSVYGEYAFPWWVTKGNDKAWQILKWDVGARWWFSRHDPSDRMDVLRGHFLGIDLGGGYYDIEPQHEGYQGEFQTVGLEYGYAFRLSPHWRLDAFVGGGWLGTHYREYKGSADDVHLIYQRTPAPLHKFVPTKAGISLKYIFTHKVRRTAK